MRPKRISIAISALCLSSLFIAAWSLADEPKPLEIFSGVTPTTGPAIVDGLLTDQQKRDKINALWNQEEGISPDTPHARWDPQAGRIVTTRVATTGPSATPADAGLSATMVSVHIDNLPARQALSAFGKQTGMHLTLFPAQAWRGSLFGNVTLNLDHVPLLEAVNELCCQGGFEEYGRVQWGGMTPPAFDPAHPRMLLGAQQVGNALAPWEICGPFAFDVESITHSLKLTKNGSTPEPLSIQFGFHAEPGVVVLGQSQMPTLIEAVDEKGHKITLSANLMPQQQQQSGGFWSRLLAPKAAVLTTDDLWMPANRPPFLSLTWPDDAGHTLVRLRATTKLLIRVKSETLDVDFSASPDAQTKTIAGFKCVVGPLNSQSPQQGNSQITIYRGKQGVADWRQFCAAIGGVTPKFMDSRGNAAQQVQLMGTNNSDDQVTASFYWFNQYYGNGDDNSNSKMTRFTMEIPTEIKTVQVPIEFDNLPLP